MTRRFAAYLEELRVELYVRFGPTEASAAIRQILRETRAHLEDSFREILENDVRPYVEQDGGEIVFAGFHDGIVEVYLQGACAGCPSSTITLKVGIEARLKQELPEVKEVVAL